MERSSYLRLKSSLVHLENRVSMNKAQTEWLTELRETLKQCSPQQKAAINRAIGKRGRELEDEELFYSQF